MHGNIQDFGEAERKIKTRKASALMGKYYRVVK